VPSAGCNDRSGSRFDLVATASSPDGRKR
jgi:hypothetical protein